MKLLEVVVFMAVVLPACDTIPPGQRSRCRSADTEVRYAPSYAQQGKLGKPGFFGSDEAYVRKGSLQGERFVLLVEPFQSQNDDPRYFQTSDNGRTWKKVNQEPSNINVFGSPLLATPTNPRVIYRLYQDIPFLYLRSDDGGDTWVLPKYEIEGQPMERFAVEVSKSKAFHVVFTLLAIDPRDAHTLYAGLKVVQWASSLTRLRPYSDIQLTGVYISHDGGETWIKFTEQLYGFVPLGISPLKPNLMYGLGPGGLVKSSNGGAHWTPVRQQQPFETSIGFVNETREQQQERERLGRKTIEIRQFVFDTLDQNTLYIVSNKGVYKSQDGGDTLCLLDLGFDEIDGINSLVVNPLNPAQIFLGTRYGVFVSLDEVGQFQRVFPIEVRADAQ